jgi:DNA replication protein DnaC
MSTAVIAIAILDRLLHHSFPFIIDGPSYRMKELFGKKKQKMRVNLHQRKMKYKNMI